MKLKLSLENEEIRKVWEVVERAAANVANWPPSKRGGLDLPSTITAPAPPPARSATDVPITSVRAEA